MKSSQLENLTRVHLARELRVEIFLSGSICQILHPVFLKRSRITFSQVKFNNDDINCNDDVDVKSKVKEDDVQSCIMSMFYTDKKFS